MIGYLFVDKGAPDRLVAKALLLQVLDDLAHLPQTVLPQVALPHQVDAAFVCVFFALFALPPERDRDVSRSTRRHKYADAHRRSRRADTFATVWTIMLSSARKTSECIRFLAS